MREELPNDREWTAGIIWALAAILLVLVVVAMIAGCDSPKRVQVVYHRNARINVQVPPLQMEAALRQHNYGPSCSHAGFQNPLAVAGLFRVIEHWRKRFDGGAFIDEIEQIASRYGLRTAKTTNGSLRFLVACHKAGVPAMVHYFRLHSVTFIRFSRDYKYVILQEVNSPREIPIPVKTFVRRWNAYGRGYGYSGGVALSLSPVQHPPRPVIPPCSQNTLISF